MARLPRTLGLVEAYRFILRAVYPARPELADEITSAWFFVWPTTAKSPEEIQAAKNARKLLEDGIAKERIRLHGVLDASLPRQNVNPADARIGKLDIFDQQLVVSRYGSGVVRRYRDVACYETDLHQELKSNGVTHQKRTSAARLGEFARRYKEAGGRPTQGAFTEAAEKASLNVTRDQLRAEFHITFPGMGRGRPKGSSGKIAKK